jgi:predicted outer membrane protein
MVAGCAASALIASAPAAAQRRGETMKVTAADARKALVTPTDEGFVRGASGAYQHGSKLAMLASIRATDPTAKALGARLVDDFIGFGTKLKPAASGEKGYQWSNAPAPDDQKSLDELERLQGADLDHALPVQFTALLEQLKAACAAEVEKGRDPDLKPVAREALPWIEKRLQEARALRGAPHR